MHRGGAVRCDARVKLRVAHQSSNGGGDVFDIPFVHEQAVSITNHRFGNPTPLSQEVLPTS